MGFTGRKPGRRTRAGRFAAIVAALSLVGATSQVANTPAGAVPVADFVEESYATGLLGITDLEWAANGLLYTGHKNGTVRVVDNGVVLGTVLDIRSEVNDDSERGMLGIAVHPDLLDGSPYLYALYAYDPPEAAGQTGLAGRDGGGQRVARLTRFTLDEGTGYTSVTGGGTTILGAAGTWATAGDPFDTAGEASPEWACGTGPYVDNCLPADAGFHGSGNLTFGPDGMLYVGMGDGADFSTESRSLRAIDVNSLAGKVLRIDPDTGLGVASNPYWTGDGNDNASRVLYLGNRNPYRFSFGPGGELWIGDVGSGEFEEVNEAAPGTDFGWPCYEGGANGSLQQNPDFAVFAACQSYYSSNSAVAPYYAYSHDPGSAAIIAGEIVTNPAWPASMRDGLVVADYVRQTVSVLETDGTPSEIPLATDVLAVDMTFGPDGHLYLANVHNGSIVRIRYSPGEEPPGMLRITSSPPVPTVISANGLERSSWGLDWLEVQPGTYEICFDDVPGFATPGCRNVPVSSGLTGVSVGEFTAQGNLVVSATLSGSGAPVEGVISIDGQPAGEGGVSTFRDPGLHEVCWGAVADLAPPSCQIIDLLPGQVLPISGVYDTSPGAPGPGPHGFLRTVSNPAVPTTITVDGIAASQWSTEWVPHAPGTYEICFSDVPGYITPDCQSIVIVEGATTTVSGDFVRKGSLRATTAPPANVVVSVDGVPRNNWGLLTTMAPGTYTVCAEHADPTCAQTVISSGLQAQVELPRTGVPDNQPPVAFAGSNQTVTDSDANGEESVTLDGSGSFDPDGTIVSHDWRIDGALIASGVAPTVSLPIGTHTVALTVTDDGGAVAADTTVVTVNPAPNDPPVADAGADVTATDLDGSGDAEVALDGSASFDPDGSIVSYEWWFGDLLIATVASPTVTMPVGSWELVLGVTDDRGATDSDIVIVTVDEVANESPTASAGPDQTVEDADDSGSETVTLDGSGSSDPDGFIGSHEWREGGVVIGTGVSPSISFGVGVHTVELTVTDDDGATATDTVQITVEEPPDQPPSADAGDDQTVVDADGTGAESVTLDGSGSSDPDGTIVSYQWRVGGSLVATGVSPSVSFTVGVHSVELTVTDDDGATATDLVGITVEAAPDPVVSLYISTDTADAVGGVTFDVEDVIAQNQDTGAWSMVLDLSDVGLAGENVKAIHRLDDGSWLLSFESTAQVDGVGNVSSNDLVRFVPTSTGATTAGTFELYLDGSDVGLTSGNEAIDAVAVLANGDIVVSTLGSGGAGGVSFADEDLIRFDPTSLGGSTSGSWSIYLDGSDVGLTQSSEDIKGLGRTDDGSLHFAALQDWDVPGGLSGDNMDVFTCGSPVTGSSSSCSYSMFFDGSAEGLSVEIDAVFIGES